MDYSYIVLTLHDYKEDSPYRKYMPPLDGKEDEIASGNARCSRSLPNPAAIHSE